MPAPSKDQLRQVYTRAGEDRDLTPEQAEALCNQAGIAKGVVAKVLEAGKFHAVVSLEKFLFLMLAMGCADFEEVLQGIFDVFGTSGAVNAQLFAQLIEYLQGDMDPDVTTQFVLELAEEVADLASITFREAKQLGTISRKLAGPAAAEEGS